MRPLLRGLALLSGAAAGPALAQMLPPEEGLVRFSRFTAVRERSITGYSASGIRVGSFTLSPSLNTSVEYNDNVFGFENGAVDDAYVRFAPMASLQSNWSGRSLTLAGTGRVDRYANQTSEDVEAIEGSAYGVQEFGDSTRLRLLGRYREDREARESQTVFALTERPVKFTKSTFGIGASQRFASLLVSGEAGVTHSNYSDAQLNGANFDEDFRDSNQRRLRLRTEVAQSSALAYFAQATYDDTKYRNPTAAGLERGSKVYELLGGVRFELPIAVRGELGFGYSRADYRGTRFRSFSGLGINSRVQFFPTELTTVTVTAERSVEDSGIIASSAYVALSGGVRVDHELLRNLILTANLQYERDSFNGIDRRDGRLGLTAGADYRMNRNLTARFSFDRLDLNSTGADRFRDLARNRVMIGIGVRA